MGSAVGVMQAASRGDERVLVDRGMGPVPELVVSGSMQLVPDAQQRGG